MLFLCQFCDVVNGVGCSLQRVFAQAKNGDELFWEEKFDAANGRAQACTQGNLLFLPFKFWGAEKEGFFFHFSLLPNVFPLCSLEVPKNPKTLNPTIAISVDGQKY